MTRKEAEEKLAEMSVYDIERIVEEMNPKLLHDYVQDRKRKYYLHRHKTRLLDAIILTAESTDVKFDFIDSQCPVCLNIDGHKCSVRLPWAREDMCDECREKARLEQRMLEEQEAQRERSARFEARKRIKNMTLKEVDTKLYGHTTDYYEYNVKLKMLESVMTKKLLEDGWPNEEETK